MFTSLNRMLDAKRRREESDQGFTLIELLIVVLIIGILAAIAIPIYLSVTGSAKDNSAKTSVTDAKTALVAYYTQNGAFPTAADQAGLTAAGYTPATDITMTYSASGTAFCVTAVNGGKLYVASDLKGATVSTKAASAACASGVAAP